MSKTIAEEFPIAEFNGIAVNTSVLSSSSNYYSYSSRTVKYIVLHYTGNSSDTAKANATYFSGGSRSGSAHYFVDNNSCYQSVALNNAAWAVGGTSSYKHAECRNKNSVSIEMCTSGNYAVSEQTEANAAYLTAALCRYMGITADIVDTYVIRHWDVWAKDCPSGWTGSNNARWAGFKERVKSILNNESEDLTMTQYEELQAENERQNEIINTMGQEIAELKNAANPMIYNYIDDNMPDWARPTIQKMVDKGFLQGDETGSLGLTEELLRIFVTNDRAGVYGE